jgi:hypothetical protein
LDQVKHDEFAKSKKKAENVMLNLIQHLTKSIAYETLKQVQGDKSELFTRPSSISGLFNFPVKIITKMLFVNPHHNPPLGEGSRSNYVMNHLRLMIESRTQRGSG